MTKYTEKEQIKDAFLVNIGLTIRRGRRKKKWSQENLAKELGVTKSTLSRYESGNIDMPASTLAYASYVCDFPMEDYVFEQGTKQRLSDVFKTIVKKDPRIEYEMQCDPQTADEDDKWFDQYIETPEAEQKRRILLLSAYMVRMLREDGQIDKAQDISDIVIECIAKDSDEQRSKRLFEYANRLRQNR